MMERSETIGKLMAALAKAQSEMGNAPRDRENPHFKSQYATLESVRAACLPILAKHNIAVAQFPGNGSDGAITVTTTFACGDEWIASTVGVKPQRQDAQGMGSAITYLRRYSLAAMAGIAPADDDANSACDTNVQPREFPRENKRDEAKQVFPDKPKAPIPEAKTREYFAREDLLFAPRDISQQQWTNLFLHLVENAPDAGTLARMSAANHETIEALPRQGGAVRDVIKRRMGDLSQAPLNKEAS